MQYQSEQINELAKAFAAAQSEIEAAPKNAENPHLRSQYADIASVWSAVRAILPKHGLSVAQVMVPCEDGKVCVRTTLLHISGQWLAGECALPCPKQDPQGYGSAITYARRYSLSAMLGVVSEADDDGHGAKSGDNGKSQTPPKKTGSNFSKPTAKPDSSKPAELATEIQVKEIQALFANLAEYQPEKFKAEERINLLNEWLAHYKLSAVSSAFELTQSQANNFIAGLNKKLAGIQQGATNAQ